MNTLLLLLLVVFSVILIINHHHQIKAEVTNNDDGPFIRTRGIQFVLNGKPFYANGFNAYWLMYIATAPSDRNNVTSAFIDAGNHGLSIVRTMAFNDGDRYRALQPSPGSYTEEVFQGLDFAVAEAGKYGMKMIVCLVNNFNNFGGRLQYVEWGRSKGEKIESEDGFFTNNVVKEMYKNHVKTIINRRNTITGIVYKDDPTIMAWELINEPRCPSDPSGSTLQVNVTIFIHLPRCPSDPSGSTLQAWITEMAAYVKSIDKNHMVDIGMEGFYGPKNSERQQNNPNFNVGTDFIANNQIPDIDFATVHSYPDSWYGSSSEEIQLQFLNNWVNNHIEDAQTILKKPVIFEEFGKSNKDAGFSISKRDKVFETIYSAVYSSAIKEGAAAGGLFWHLLTTGVEFFKDGYEIILSDNSSTNSLIAEESKKLKMIPHIM